MKLYYSPGACSLSPHIALCEAGLDFELVKADLQAHKLADGSDFYAISAKGYVPLLELDNGERLSEGPAIVQYIADQAPGKDLAPANGTMARYRLQEWLNFVTSELHKAYGLLFNPKLPAETRASTVAKLRTRYEWVDQQLAGNDYLMGESFTVADGYLFTVTTWAGHAALDLAGLENLAAFQKRVAARPAVQAAMAAEGLARKAA